MAGYCWPKKKELVAIDTKVFLYFIGGRLGAVPDATAKGNSAGGR